MLATLSKKKKAKRTKRTKRPKKRPKKAKRYQLPRGMDYYTYDLFCGPVRRPNANGRHMKLHLAEVLWAQTTLGQTHISIDDWHNVLYPGMKTKSAERGWERFKANLIRWHIPHEKRDVHFARHIGSGASCRVEVGVLLSSARLDEWFRDHWGVDFDEEEEDLTEAEYHLITALDLLRRFRASHLRWGVRCDCDVCKQTKELIQRVGEL